MIKNFIHPVAGKNQEFCITMADGTANARAMVSRVESPETLVMMEATGPIAALKARFESADTFLDDAIEKVKASGLLEKAVESGSLQTGSL